MEDSQKIVSFQNQIRSFEEGIKTLDELILLYEEFEQEIKANLPKAE